MIEDEKSGTKPLYEPPKVMKLDGKNSSMGDCVGSGSGDIYVCYLTGNSASGGCLETGSAANEDCEFEGLSAAGTCWDGNTGNP